MRTNIELDDEPMQRVQALRHFSTKNAAAQSALMNGVNALKRLELQALPAQVVWQGDRAASSRQVVWQGDVAASSSQVGCQGQYAALRTVRSPASPSRAV